MKKIVLASTFGLFSLSAAFGQDAIQKATVDQLRKEKEKSDTGLNDPKSNVKAAFWMERAKTYEGIALNGSEIDSVAANKALEAYKKVVELDLTKKGEPGKSAKDAQKAIAGGEGTNLYQAFFKQGAEQYQIKNLGSALTLFKTAQEINPKDTTVALYGGITAQQLEKNDVAIANFETYAANGGKDPAVFYGLSELYSNAKDFDKATKTLQLGLERAPGNKDLNSAIVNLMIRSGNREKAIEGLQGLVKADPSNAVNIVNLAMLYDNMTHDANAKIKTLSGKLGAGSSKATSLGKDLEAEKEKISIFDGEVKRIGALIKKQPSNADLKRQLKDVNDKRAEAKAAITKIQGEITEAEANAKTTDTASLDKELAQAKADRDQFSKLAIENYQKALAVDGKNVDALYNLGVFYFNDAVALKGEVDNMNMTEYAQRGKEVEGRVCGRFQKAKPYFEKAIEVNGLADAKENLEMVNNLLAQFEGKGVKCIVE